LYWWKCMWSSDVSAGPVRIVGARGTPRQEQQLTPSCAGVLKVSPSPKGIAERGEWDDCFNCHVPHFSDRLTCTYFGNVINVSCTLQDVSNYLLRLLSADDETLLCDVRRRCKSFRDLHQWLVFAFNSLYNGMHISALPWTPTGMLWITCYVYGQGLQAILFNRRRGRPPCNGWCEKVGQRCVAQWSEDKAKDYCISGFTIDNYSSLLEERQRLYPKWCRWSIFAKTIVRKCMYKNPYPRSSGGWFLSTLPTGTCAVVHHGGQLLWLW